jgi:hypothetical protein
MAGIVRLDFCHWLRGEARPFWAIQKFSAGISKASRATDGKLWKLHSPAGRAISALSATTRIIRRNLGVGGHDVAKNMMTLCQRKMNVER